MPEQQNPDPEDHGDISAIAFGSAEARYVWKPHPDPDQEGVYGVWDKWANDGLGEWINKNNLPPNVVTALSSSWPGGRTGGYQLGGSVFFGADLLDDAPEVDIGIDFGDADDADDAADEEEDDGGFWTRMGTNLGSAGPGPFAMLAPWAAWNALPNMISQLERTMDYWLTRNQQVAMENNKQWTALRMMAMATGHDYDPETGEYNLPGQPFEGDGGGGGYGGGGYVGGGGGIAPSKIVNLASSETSPTQASYGDGIGVNTAPQPWTPMASGAAIRNLTAGVGGTDPLSELVSQGLGSTGRETFSGVVEPAVSLGGAEADLQAATQLFDQTVGAGQFVGGLGAQAGQLGLEAFETAMRKQQQLIGPLMLPVSKYIG